MINKLAFTFFAAVLVSTIAVAQVQPPPAPPLTSVDIQVTSYKSHIASYRTSINDYGAALEAAKALLAKDTAALGELCRTTVPIPAGCDPVAKK
jgi:hypothetical protein